MIIFRWSNRTNLDKISKLEPYQRVSNVRIVEMSTMKVYHSLPRGQVQLELVIEPTDESLLKEKE